MVIAYTAVHQQLGNALLAHLMIYFIAFAKMLIFIATAIIDINYCNIYT